MTDRADQPLFDAKQQASCDLRPGSLGILVGVAQVCAQLREALDPCSPSRCRPRLPRAVVLEPGRELAVKPPDAVLLGEGHHHGWRRSGRWLRG